jgi:hypothetical protein
MGTETFDGCEAAAARIKRSVAELDGKFAFDVRPFAPMVGFRDKGDDGRRCAEIWSDCSERTEDPCGRFARPAGSKFEALAVVATRLIGERLDVRLVVVDGREAGEPYTTGVD